MNHLYNGLPIDYKKILSVKWVFFSYFQKNDQSDLSSNKPDRHCSVWFHPWPFILVSEVIINSKETRTGTMLGTIVILHGIFHVATNSKTVHSSSFNNICKHAYKAKMQRQRSLGDKCWTFLNILCACLIFFFVGCR